MLPAALVPQTAHIVLDPANLTTALYAGGLAAKQAPGHTPTPPWED